MTTHLSVASWNLALNAAIDVLSGGWLEIYDGTQPATPDVAVTTQHKLAKLALPNPAFGAASSGTKTANAIASVSALFTSTATWYRAFKSDDATAVIDGAVGASGSGAECILNTTSIVAGGSVTITIWTVSEVAGQ